MDFGSARVVVSSSYALGLQVYKLYVIWALKYVHMIYVGLFGAPGWLGHNRSPASCPKGSPHQGYKLSRRAKATQTSGRIQKVDPRILDSSTLMV